jgi:hypothetical protein
MLRFLSFFYLATKVSIFVGRTRWAKWSPPIFFFPEGCLPNISDATTYETMGNETELFASMDNMMLYTLANNSQWEETVLFEDLFANETHWEQMMRFGTFD